MQPGHPSRTALGAAAHRAAHQALEGGRIFADPLALQILGADADAAVRRAAADPSRRRLRLFIAVRTRFAEEALARALARGVRQVVVLGAGLDTYAYRNAAPVGTRIFEVDHPATQSWKRGLLAEAGIALPPSLTFVPVDFERGRLADALALAGHDPQQRTFFTWLGVVPYLTEQAVLATLGYIAGLPGGAEVAFDYANPRQAAPQNEHSSEHEALAARVANAGEPFRSWFRTEPLRQALAGLGFAQIEDLGPDAIRARYFPGHQESASNEGGHVLWAATL